MTMREQIARAIKTEIGRQLNSRPLHGHDSDWHADGGTLDLELCADAVLAELETPDEIVGALTALVAQIDKNDFRDSLGHDAKMLKAFFDARAALAKARGEA